jgi:hypothetical protein
MSDAELSDGRLQGTLATAESLYGGNRTVAALVREAAIALHESSGYAAGKPDDALWQRTYRTIERLVSTLEPLSASNDTCVARLRSFLEENGDLATPGERGEASPEPFAASAIHASAKR